MVAHTGFITVAKRVAAAGALTEAAEEEAENGDAPENGE